MISISLLLAFSASITRISDCLPNPLDLPPAETLEAADPSTETRTIISAAIDAVGGAQALEQLENVTYHTPQIYRSQTLSQNYNLEHSDQTLATSGSQNTSFRVVDGHIYARVERRYSYDAYWIWAFPTLQPSIDFTCVLSDGPSGASYACFTEGQNSFFVQDPSQALDYADDYLADYLYHHARTFALPGLLQSFAAQNNTVLASSLTDPLTNTTYPAVTLKPLGVTLVLNRTSHLPYMVRSYENHAIFGPSTDDIIFSNYRPVKLHGNASLTLPHRFQTVYNSKDVIEDFLIDAITLNPVFPNDFFVPLPRSSSNSSAGDDPVSTVANSSSYDRAEVHDFFEASLWSRPFAFTNTSSVVSIQPDPSLPQVHAVYVGDYADYVQLVIEFANGVLVTDAPPHRSTILLDWIEETFHKSVQYVVPSHHHHDHAYGIGDYVRAGVTIVAPSVAADFYRNVNKGTVNVLTYNESAQFILSDASIQFCSFFHPDPPHAKDWTYSLVTKACSAAVNISNATAAADKVAAVLFNADVWSPGGQGLRWDMTGARQWLNFLVEDGVPLNSVVIGAHGSVDSSNGESSGSTTEKLQVLAQITAFGYPDFGGDVFC